MNPEETADETDITSRVVDETSSVNETGSMQQPSVNESNPLLQSVVLQTLFNVVPLDDIRVFRQVNKFWWKESLKRWRRDTSINLSGQSSQNGSLSLKSYLALADKCPTNDPFQLVDYPFKRFILSHWNISFGDGDQVKFWNEVGSQMTHLGIAQSSFKTKKDFQRVLFDCVPNLKALQLTSRYPIVEDGDSKDINKTPQLASAPQKLEELGLHLAHTPFSTTRILPISYVEFFGHYPYLKKLELTFANSSFGFEERGRDVGEVLTAMLDLKKNHGIQWKLTNLDIMNLFGGSSYLHNFDTAHVNMLQQLQFPLTSFSLDIGELTVSETFKQILELYAPTLRKLVVFRKDAHSIMPDNSFRGFPFAVHLDSLTEMRLLGGAVVPNLQFLEYTPNLKSLFLVNQTGESLLDAGSHFSEEYLLYKLRHKQTAMRWDYHENCYPVISSTYFSRLDAVLPKMEEFVMSGKHYKVCSARQVAELARIMPNLKRLRLGMGNDGFRVLCERWKGLEALIIQPSEVDDSGIAGIIPTLNVRLPNLMDLTKLQYFAFGRESTLYFPPPREGPPQLLRALQNLNDMVGVFSDRITHEALEQFRTNFPHCKIVPYKEGNREWPELRVTGRAASPGYDADSWTAGDSEVEEENEIGSEEEEAESYDEYDVEDFISTEPETEENTETEEEVEEENGKEDDVKNVHEAQDNSETEQANA